MVEPGKPSRHGARGVSSRMPVATLRARRVRAFASVASLLPAGSGWCGWAAGQIHLNGIRSNPTTGGSNDESTGMDSDGV